MKVLVIALIAFCGVASATKHACPCPLIYAPVCGSNGVTYPNDCALRCEQKDDPALKMVSHGVCAQVQSVEEEMCVCNKMYMPVCGSDGLTYSNPCILNCKAKSRPGLTIERYGACADETVAKMVKPCMCTREYNPVCGTDGVTYGNPCTFSCAASQDNGIKMAYKGECRDPCICTREYMPVCGTDGKTYGNKCVLNCEASTHNGLKMAYQGMCKTVEAVADPCVCTQEYNPVCGNDGETYSNPCVLRCVQSNKPSLKMAYEGECQVVEAIADPCVCTQEYNPVCGNDGETYSNPCVLRCVQSNKPSLSVSYMGECRKPCMCTRELNPVCGTDGKTYGNPCMLQCAAQTTNVAMDYMGQCRDPCVCTREYNPVCGSDGQTYGNPCTFRCAQHSDKGLQVVSMGACQNQVEARDVCICTMEWAPVCGSDGKTYGNLCGLNCAAKTNNGITMVHRGSCDDTVYAPIMPICPAIWAPVCGSDGKTYSNYCEFNYNAQENPTLAKLHEGPC